MPETTIGIAAVAYHLPGPRKDLVDWAAEHEVSESRLQSLLANGCRYFYDGPEHSDVDLIVNAIERLNPSDANWLKGVRYLVHAHTEAFSMPAPPSSIITELATCFKLQLTLGFSICQLACASAIHAIDRAAKLLQSDPEASYALVVTADRVFGASHRLRQMSGIQSDGGSAILLAKEDSASAVLCRLGTTSFRNFARLYDGPTTSVNVATIGRYTWLHTKQLLQRHSELSGLSLNQVGRFLPINADRDYWMMIARSLSLPSERFFLENIGERGHACCADFAVNLVDAGLQHLKLGEVVVACAQSNVGAYAAQTLLPVQGVSS